MIARRVALVAALLLLAYVVFSVAWTLTELLRVVVPTPTRTPQPAYTPAAAREVLLVATATLIPSPTLTPSATPTATPSATPTPQLRQHVVQAGDALLDIAEQYEVDLRALLAANDISNADVLYVGQVLTVPSSAPTPAPDQRTHIVQAGETLLGIAEKYGVATEALLQANGIVDPDRIYEGQVLIVPE